MTVFRNKYAESCTDTLLSINCNSAAMEIHESLYQVEAEPYPLIIPGRRRVHLIEEAEYLVQLLPGYSYSCIRHDNLNAVIPVQDLYCYLSTLVIEFYCIPQEVGENIGKPPHVTQ